MLYASDIMTQAVSTANIADLVYHTFRRLHTFEHYTGILALHGQARLALTTGDKAILESVKTDLQPFLQGNGKEFRCNFPNYHCGGLASAFLLYKGHLPEVRNAARYHCDLIMKKAPRGEDGILCHPRAPEKGLIFIDVAYAITPFLLYTGLSENQPEWIEEGCHQITRMYELFLDDTCGLLHQCKNFNGAGNRSHDHWSRGNGWGLLALAELVDGLPADHPRRPKAEEYLRNLLLNCLRYQDTKGLWHQEITREDSFVETSGTSLILFALGIALQHKVVREDEGRAALERGLRGLLSYIALDGSIHNTCEGCLCPGDGSILEYMNKRHPINDCHAFGAVSLAFGQAYALGIHHIEL